MYDLERIGWKLDLERIREFLQRLGEPHRRFAAIHVAGTNGKGSVSSMLESILRSAGCRTGLYTSPHLVDLRERLRVDRVMIGRADLAAWVSGHRAVIEEVGCTFFETMTGLAFDWFAARGVEWAVVEVGMGGRLDATNLLQPQLSAVTNISFDHMQYLGATLVDIAREKGGIFKPGVPVVLGRMPRPASELLSAMARDGNCAVHAVDQLCSVTGLRMGPGGSEFDLQTDTRFYRALQIRLPGPHQVANAQCAVLAAEHLPGFPGGVPENIIRQGLATANWPGRFEAVRREPMIVIDVAHNPDGVRRLSWMLRHFYHDANIALVIGVLQDKDYDRMIDSLPGDLAMVFAVPAPGHRGLGAKDLAVRLSRRFPQVTSCATVADGLRQAGAWKVDNRLICITGSHYIVGEALRTINHLTM